MLHRHKPLLLSTWPGVLFLVQFNNFDQTTDFYWSYTLLLKTVRSYALLLYVCSAHDYINNQSTKPPDKSSLRMQCNITHYAGRFWLIIDVIICAGGIRKWETGMFTILSSDLIITTVDREIFTLRIIRVKIFRGVKFLWFRLIHKIFLTVDSCNRDERLEHC